MTTTSFIFCGILCFHLFPPFITAENVNVTLIETLRINDNSNVNLNLFIPAKNGMDFKDSVKIFTNMMVNNSNQAAINKYLKLGGLVEISRNSNISLKAFFGDKNEGFAPEGLTPDSFISFVSEVFSTLVEKVLVETVRPFDVRKYGRMIKNRNENATKSFNEIKTEIFDPFFRVIAEILRTLLANTNDEKVKLSENVHHPLVKNRQSQNASYAVSEAKIKSSLEEIVNTITEFIEAVVITLEKKHPEYVKRMNVIDKNLHRDLDEDNDIRSKLLTLKNTTHDALNEIWDIEEEGNLSQLTISVFGSLKGLLTHLRLTINHFLKKKKPLFNLFHY